MLLHTDTFAHKLVHRHFYTWTCRVSFRVSVSLIMYHNARTTSPRCCQDGLRAFGCDCRTKIFYTQTLSFTQRLLHTETFTQRRFYTQTLSHTDSFTQKLSHTNTFTRNRFDTQTLIHRHFYTETFTHRCFYTQTLLHTDDFRDIIAWGA